MDVVPQLVHNTYFTHPKIKEFYYVGNLELLKLPKICVIGSRKMSQYGKLIVENFVSSLQGLNIATVSGFVEGVDFECFYQSAKMGIPTIAVLGYGFNFLNKDLIKKVGEINLENCLFISEFSNDLAPKIYTFPTRDETLAYISDIILVVEASEKSGTFYTVKRAFKENKKVYAAGGSIFSPLCKGNYFLLKKGFGKQKANLYTEPNDILQNFHQVSDAQIVKKELSEIELKIITSISTSPCNFDEICKLININSSELLTTLTELELKEEVIYKNGIYYKTI